MSGLRHLGFVIACESSPDPKYWLVSGPGSLAPGSYVCPVCSATIFIGEDSDSCHHPHCEVIKC